MTSHQKVPQGGVTVNLKNHYSRSRATSLIAEERAFERCVQLRLQLPEEQCIARAAER